MAGETDHILFEQRGATGWITINRPEARNALTFEMYDRIAEICNGVNGIPGLKALVFIGAGGKAFAAGTDISRFRDFRTAEDAWAYEARMTDILNAIEQCEVPTIAAISGACTGGGGGIAASCDLRIATEDLRFGFPIARTLGNCLSIATLSRLVSLIGMARVKDLIFTSRLIEAEEARSLGLVNAIHRDFKALQAAAEELAGQVAARAPLTLRATKLALSRMRERAAEIDDADLVALCYTSADFREGLEAFLAKRKPNWTGK